LTLWALLTAAAALRATSWEVDDIWFIAVATCSIWVRWPATAWLLCAETFSTCPAWRSTWLTVCPTRSIRSWIFATVPLNTWPSSPSSSRLWATKSPSCHRPRLSIIAPRRRKVVRVEA
jgi:hypothetical protein